MSPGGSTARAQVRARLPGSGHAHTVGARPVLTERAGSKSERERESERERGREKVLSGNSKVLLDPRPRAPFRRKERDGKAHVGNGGARVPARGWRGECQPRRTHARPAWLPLAWARENAVASHEAVVTTRTRGHVPSTWPLSPSSPFSVTPRGGCPPGPDVREELAQGAGKRRCPDCWGAHEAIGDLPRARPRAAGRVAAAACGRAGRSPADRMQPGPGLQNGVLPFLIMPLQLSPANSLKPYWETVHISAERPPGAPGFHNN